MVEALAIAVISVAFGAYLGLSNALGRRVLGAIQTFGLTAALGLVLLQLLPEAFARLGWIALVLFVVASRLPGWLESIVQRAARRQRSHALGLDLAFVGFAIHQVADGVSMGNFAEGAHAGHEHGDYFLAIAGHTVPLTALFVGMIAAARGKRTAVGCAVGLAAAVALGIVLPAAVDTSHLAHADAWIGAVAAGLLFHAVGHAPAGDPDADAQALQGGHHDHDHDHNHAPTHGPTHLARILDLVAAILGMSLAVLAEHGHGHGGHVHGDATHALGDAVVFTGPLGAVACVIGLGLARRRVGRLDAAARLATGWVLPWFVVGTLVVAALLSVGEPAFVDRLPIHVVLPAQAVGALLAFGSLGLVLLLGTRTFLLQPLRLLNAHGDHAHDEHGHAHGLGHEVHAHPHGPASGPPGHP